jgi:NADP-dependent 3-hydroxy acid dehydrogenase YdfG
VSGNAGNDLVLTAIGDCGSCCSCCIRDAVAVLLADKRQENANAAAEVLSNAGYDVTVATVDVASRDNVHRLVETATGLGEVTGLVHAAGVSPSCNNLT